MINWLEYRVEPFTLHSGAQSHWMIHGERIYQYSEMRSAVILYWTEQLERIGLRARGRPETDPVFVVGVPRGGSLWGRCLADALDCFYCEPAALPMVAASSTVVFVDDVVTTGASFREAHGLVRYGDLNIRAFFLAVADRSPAQTRLSFDWQPGQYYPWLRMPLPMLPEGA